MAAASTCFVHVPKTGGSWVTEALRTAFTPAQLHEVPSAEVGHVPVPQLLERYAAVTGHFTMADLDAVLGHAFLFTFLRHPIDRVLSLYYFYREQNGDGRLDPRVLQVQALDFPSFVAQLPTRVSPWSNWQTYVFSGVAHCEFAAEDLLPLALENLERVDFVGVQDHLAEGVAALASMRGWNVAPPPHRVNVTRQREPVDKLLPAAVARLEDLNRCDMELFRIARQRWHARRGRPDVTAPRPARNLLPGMLRRERREMGTRELVITAATVNLAERLVRVHVQSSIAERDVTLGIRITNATGEHVYGTNTRLLGQRLHAVPNQSVVVDFALPDDLPHGSYYLTAAAHRGVDHLEGCFHWIDNAVRFDA